MKKNYSNELNQFQKNELASLIIVGIMQGKSRQELKSIIEENSPFKLTENAIENVIEFAEKTFENDISTDQEQVMHMHIALYEKIYQYFNSIGIIGVKYANKALKHKEMLLGLHKKTTPVKINKTTNIKLMKTVEYDISQLTEAQRERFQFLIDKATVK